MGIAHAPWLACAAGREECGCIMHHAMAWRVGYRIVRVWCGSYLLCGSDDGQTARGRGTQQVGTVRTLVCRARSRSGPFRKPITIAVLEGTSRRSRDEILEAAGHHAHVTRRIAGPTATHMRHGRAGGCRTVTAHRTLRLRPT
eukprot:4850666-Prymnesium_polylepis.1